MCPAVIPTGAEESLAVASVCHSERSEESLIFLLSLLNDGESMQEWMVLCSRI